MCFLAKEQLHPHHRLSKDYGPRIDPDLPGPPQSSIWGGPGSLCDFKCLPNSVLTLVTIKTIG